MNNTTKILSGLGFGAITTLVLATGMLKPTVKLTALATLVSVPVIGVVNEIIQSRAEKRIKALRNELFIAQQDSHRLQAVSADNNRLSQHLVSLKVELSQLQDKVSSLKSLNSNLKESQQLQSAQLQVERREKTELTEQITGYEESYNADVESEVQQRVEEYITSDRAKLDAKYRSTLIEGQAIHAEAVAIAKAYEEWAEQIGERHVERKNYILGLTKEFNHHIGGAEQDWETERGHLITQIEVLTEKIARLQQKLAGDLTEPEYGQFGYAIEGKIANDIARYVWDTLQIPLTVKGYEKRSDGAVDVGYGYGRSIPLEALHRDLNRHSEDIAKTLRIHKISSIRKLEIADLLVLTYRRSPAIKQDDLKRLLTPVDKLATQVIREMSRKGTVRIMGATGDGKGVCARYLLSRIVTTLNWYIRLHDPQHGSDQDHWDIPKVSKSGTELKQALKKITSQMKDREVTKIHSPVTLDVLDEIDTQLEKEDKEQFLNLISRIRHLGMKLILIGQNPKVSRAGFQWSDMAQMIAFYQGSCALDAIKNNPALELKKDILLKQYNEISTVFEAKNEWLDDNKKYYFGLCVIPGKNPHWYELPVADELEVNEGQSIIGETFEVTLRNYRFVEGQKSAKTQPSAVAHSSQEQKQAKAETLTQQEIEAINAEKSVIPHVGGSAKSRHRAKTICKKHPGVELRQGKDGRYYCPGCKRKLRKDELAVEV